MFGVGAATRMAEITRVLATATWHWSSAAFGVEGCGQLSCRVRCLLGGVCLHHESMENPLPARLANLAERLGPTFVKAGQTLAIRPDLVPERYASALHRLHERVEPFGHAAVVRVIESELGAPVGELFAAFDPDPVGAASLSQVHRARLHDDSIVAVKVQRPGVDGVIRSDLRLLSIVAGLADAVALGRGGFNARDAVREVTAHLILELDLREEGRVTDAVAENHSDDPDVVIPRVYWSHTARRVLTLEFVEGVPPSSPSDLRAAELDPDTIVEAGTRAILRQVFVHGLFHADPHPGNLRILRGNRIAFLDFGMHGYLGVSARRRIALALVALAEGDAEALAVQLLRLGSVKQGGDPSGFRNEVTTSVRTAMNGRRRPSIAALLLGQIGAGRRHGIAFPRDLLLLARVLVQLEGTAGLIAPERDPISLIKPALSSIMDSLLPSPTSLQDVLAQNRFGVVGGLLELPELLTHLDLAAQRSEAQSPRGWSPRSVVGLGLLLAAVLGRRRNG